MSGAERWRRFAEWVHDHGKFSAIVIALVVGLVLGVWLR